MKLSYCGMLQHRTAGLAQSVQLLYHSPTQCILCITYILPRVVAEQIHMICHEHSMLPRLNVLPIQSECRQQNYTTHPLQ